MLIIFNIEEVELSDSEFDEVYVDVSDCGKEGVDDVYSYGDCVSGGGIVENIEDVINLYEVIFR